MKSYTTWILFFSLAFWLSMIAVYAYIWNSPIFPWALIIGAVCWIVGLWGFYFTERSNRRRYRKLNKALGREEKRAQEDRLEAEKEKESITAENKRRNILTGSRLNMDELKKHIKEETA